MTFDEKFAAVSSVVYIRWQSSLGLGSYTDEEGDWFVVSSDLGIQITSDPFKTPSAALENYCTKFGIVLANDVERNRVAFEKVKENFEKDMDAIGK